MLMKVLSELRASSWTALLAKQKRVSLRRLGGMRFSRDFMAVDEKMMGHLHLPLLLQPPREGGLLRRLGARSRCFCCLDPIPPLRGGVEKQEVNHHTLRRGVGRVGRHDSMLMYYLLHTVVERENVGNSLIVERLRRL